TLKSDVVVFPTPCPPADVDLISINGSESLKWNLTLPKSQKLLARTGAAMGLSKQRRCGWISCAIMLLCLGHPSLAQIVYSISEEAEKGTFVGNIAKDLNLNIKDLESRGLQIVSSSKERYFGVNLKTGVIFVNERIDREDICSSLVKCSLNIEALLKHPITLHRIEVNIVDINDNAPSFLPTSYVLNITELALTGDRFPLPTANDADVGSNTVRSYKLSPNEHFSVDVQSGGKQSISAELVLQKALDREKVPKIHLLLTAIDGGKPPRSGTLQIIVNVIDVNDNTPVFSKSLYKVNVSENVPTGTKILTLNATDPDEGVNSDIVYSFVGHGSLSALEVFDINPKSGEITVKGNLDYEEQAAYEIRAQATDRGHSPQSTHCKILVEVNDVNDNAPEITVTSLMTPVKEDAESGTVIALITVLDRDSGKNGRLKCVINGTSPFKLQLSYKNYYSLVVNGPLDRERSSQYTITIRATDEGTPPLSSTTNSPVGALVQTVTALDEDANENAQVTYSLLELNSKELPIST
ncbi:hypothetical protein Z043_124742, partial [Scleropages formosus]